MASQGYVRISNTSEVGGDAPTLDDLETGGHESRLSRIPEDGQYGLVGGTINRSDGYPNAPEGKWSSGLFDCFSHFPTCCMVTWCGCITLGQITQKSGLLKNGFYIVLSIFVVSCVLVPFNEGFFELFKRRTGEMIDCGSTIIVFNVAHAIRSVCGITLLCIGVLVRRRVAKTYKIPNNVFWNCCYAYFCSCCSIIQVARHLFNWHPGVGVRCDWSREPMSHWPDQPISPNEMMGREEEHILLDSNTHHDVPEPEAPLSIAHAV